MSRDDEASAIDAPVAKDESAAVGRATGIMTITIFLSRITGYLRIFALAYAIGLFGSLPNSYNLANLMPNMIYELFAGGVLSAVLIPIFTKHLVNGEKAEAWRLVNTISNLAIIILGALALVAILFPAPFVYSQTFISHDKAPVDEITFFFRIFAPQIVFYALSSIYSAILFSHKKFMMPTFAPVLNNLMVIFTVLFLFGPAYERDPVLGLWVLGIGTTLGVVVMTLVQLPAVIKLGLRYRPILEMKHPSMAKFGTLAIPVLGYVAINQAGLAVANSLAITVDGGVAALQYAWPLFHLAYALLSFPISNALFPNLSAHAARADMESFRKDVSLGIRTIGFLLIPSTLMVFALSLPLVELLLNHGAFAENARAATLTASVLQGFALGIFSFSLWMFLTKVFYALSDTKTPMWVNGVAVACNIVVNIVLVNLIGVIGIAYGHSITYTLGTLILVLALRKRIQRIEGRAVLSSLIPQFVVSAFAAALAFGIALYIPAIIPVGGLEGRIAQVAMSLLGGAALYLLAARLWNFPELYFMAKVVPGFSRLMRLRPALQDQS